MEGLPPKTLLNVNVPPGQPRGLRFTRLGHRVYSDKIVEHVDPRGRTHYWIGTGEPTWEALEGTETATTVRVRDGERVVTDGPYAETREVLGGFYLLDVPDLDAAIEWAARCPGASYGTMEVRPIHEFDAPPPQD